MMQKLKQRLNSSDPKMLQQIAHAKINLSLQITGKRDDGYHLLNSLVIFTKFGDRLSLEEASSDTPLVTQEITGPFADELGNHDDNLVMRAAQILAKELVKNGYPCSPVQITLEKNLPIASGIGGGSADAAAAIRLLKEFWEVPETLDLDRICQSLGADVSMCLHSKPLIAGGIGEVITPLELTDGFHVVLVNPLVAVSTPEIFKALNFDATNKVSEIEFANLFNEGQYDQFCNDLQSVAISQCPQIGDVLSIIAKTNPTYHAMSGSGASCFGLYKTEQAAHEALDHVKQSNSQYWAIATTTIRS